MAMKVTPSVLVDVVNLGDGRMVQGPGGLCLLQKSLAPVGIRCELTGQHLQSHGPVQAGVPGAVHHAHAPFAEGLFDGVVLELLANHRFILYLSMA